MRSTFPQRAIAIVCVIWALAWGTYVIGTSERSKRAFGREDMAEINK